MVQQTCRITIHWCIKLRTKGYLYEASDQNAKYVNPTRITLQLYQYVNMNDLLCTYITHRRYTGLPKSLETSLYNLFKCSFTLCFVAIHFLKNYFYQLHRMNVYGIFDKRSISFQVNCKWMEKQMKIFKIKSIFWNMD